MEKYSSGEIGFNLLGVCQDKLEALEKQLAEETTEFKQRFEIKLKKKLIKFFVSQLKEDIANEKSKRAQWEKDNVRRRHNWMPFVVEIVKQMAQQKLLCPAVEKVKDSFNRFSK